MRMTLVAPSRRTSCPETDTDRKDPALRHSSSRPTLAWSSARASRTAGKRETRAEISRPLAR